MSKVTSKLQVTVPKALADHYGIRPGHEIEWVAAGDVIRVVPQARTNAIAARRPKDAKFRLKLFRSMIARQREREKHAGRSERAARRGWTREELYTRGQPR